MSEKTPRLNAYVHVRDEVGQSHVFGPDSTIPTWAVEGITNPNVWEVAPVETEAPVVPPARKPGRPKKATAGSDHE